MVIRTLYLKRYTKTLKNSPREDISKPFHISTVQFFRRKKVCTLLYHVFASSCIENWGLERSWYSFLRIHRSTYRYILPCLWWIPRQQISWGFQLPISNTSWSLFTNNQLVELEAIGWRAISATVLLVVYDIFCFHLDWFTLKKSISWSWKCMYTCTTKQLPLQILQHVQLIPTIDSELILRSIQQHIQYLKSAMCKYSRSNKPSFPIPSTNKSST